MRVDNQSAFILHSRPYRDSSLIVEFITNGYGRVCGVVKGVRGTGKTAKLRRGMIQPFVPLTLGWGGNTDLKQIHRFESMGPPLALNGERLYSGFYVNELLVRLLQHYDQHPHWFALYQAVLDGLVSPLPADVILRRFELALLQELGYGIDFAAEGGSGEPVDAGLVYRFDAEYGFSRCEQPADYPSRVLFPGRDIQAIAAGDYTDSARRCAKRLCRMALAAHLGDKPLKSRELFL